MQCPKQIIKHTHSGGVASTASTQTHSIRKGGLNNIRPNTLTQEGWPQRHAPKHTRSGRVASTTYAQTHSLRKGDLNGMHPNTPTQEGNPQQHTPKHTHSGRVASVGCAGLRLMPTKPAMMQEVPSMANATLQPNVMCVHVYM